MLPFYRFNLPDLRPVDAIDASAGPSLLILPANRNNGWTEDSGVAQQAQSPEKHHKVLKA